MTEQNFFLEDWLVEVKLGRVSRDGAEKHLEPQVMKVLCFLAENAGTVVTKQELLDTLWNGSIVNDPALTRCVSQIRQAFGDNPRQPRFIATVPKVGYRMVADVRSAEQVAMARPWMWWASAAVVTLTIVTVLTNHSVASSAPPGPHTLDVRPVETLTDRANAGIVAHILERELALNLMRVEELMIIEQGTRKVMSAGSTTAAYHLAGSLEDRDSGPVYQVGLYRDGVEKPLWQHQYTAAEEDLFDVRADVVRKVATVFQAEVPDYLETRMAHRPTHDLRAWDAYLKGRDFYTQYDYVHNQNAIALFNEALRLDPDFGLAYAGLSDALVQESVFWSGQRLGQAIDAAYKAMRLEPNRGESHKALGMVLQARARNDDALEAYRRAVEIDPGAWQATYNAAVILSDRAELREAEALLQRTLELVPHHNVAMSRLGDVYLQLGDVEQARHWLDRAMERSPLRPRAVASYATLDVVTGRTESAISRCEQVLVVFFDNYSCLRLIATARLMESDWDEACKLFNRMVGRWPEDGYARLGLAQALMANGKTDKANAHVDHVLDTSARKVAMHEHKSMDYWLLAAGHSIKGDETGALRWLQTAADAGHNFYLWDSVEPAFDTLRDDSRFDQYLTAMRSNVVHAQ